jgi:hypothetical protein
MLPRLEKCSIRELVRVVLDTATSTKEPELTFELPANKGTGEFLTAKAE